MLLSSLCTQSFVLNEINSDPQLASLGDRQKTPPGHRSHKGGVLNLQNRRDARAR
jgi:hypothetical protein